MTRSSRSAERLKAPIVHALRGKEYVEYDNPYDVGMTGLIGFASGYRRDEEVRHAADAGHRLPLPPVLSRARAHRADRYPCRKRSATAARSELGLVGDVKATLKALLPQARPNTSDTSLLDQRASRLPQGAQGARRAGRKRPGQQHHPSAICHARRQRGRDGGCDLFLRRRNADRVGGALPRHERQAPPARLVQSRLDGERDAAGDRRAGGVPETPGRFRCPATAASP